ncbi:hypothetical protein [Phenylobacterium sp.]|uniref:hypothetical protein n=1 Tax=Phenylobacterium sp. TaxID=1871053 RepID=UPI003BACD861
MTYVLLLFMTAAAEQALLLELAQLGLGMARQVHAATLATTDTEPLVALAIAYTKIGRGIRQSLALRARFAAGTVAQVRPARAQSADAPAPRREDERADWTERPDWNERFATGAERLHDDPQVCKARIARDLTVVSRTPVLAAIPALQAPAAHLAGRAALLTGATLRIVNTS